ARQIGRDLGVRYVLKGSVQRPAKRVGVNAQLIDTETDGHVWAERLEHEIGDLFMLQNESTGHIAVALNFALKGEMSGSHQKKVPKGIPVPLQRIGFMGRHDGAPPGLGSGLVYDAALRVFRE